MKINLTFSEKGSLLQHFLTPENQNDYDNMERVYDGLRQEQMFKLLYDGDESITNSNEELKDRILKLLIDKILYLEELYKGGGDFTFTKGLGEITAYANVLMEL